MVLLDDVAVVDDWHGQAGWACGIESSGRTPSSAADRLLLGDPGMLGISDIALQRSRFGSAASFAYEHLVQRHQPEALPVYWHLRSLQRAW